MNAVHIIEQAMAEGLTFDLAPPDNIKVQGDKSALSRWLPIIKDHKLELLALLAGNEDETQEAIREAVAERAAIFEYDGSLSRAQAENAAELFRAFYGHLMGNGKETNCCFAPADRYCSEGRRLRNIYYKACS